MSKYQVFALGMFMGVVLFAFVGYVRECWRGKSEHKIL